MTDVYDTRPYPTRNTALEGLAQRDLKHAAAPAPAPAPAPAAAAAAAAAPAAAAAAAVL
jgi:hypothetical protein